MWCSIIKVGCFKIDFVHHTLVPKEPRSQWIIHVTQTLLLLPILYIISSGMELLWVSSEIPSGCGMGLHVMIGVHFTFYILEKKINFIYWQSVLFFFYISVCLFIYGQVWEKKNTKNIKIKLFPPLNVVKFWLRFFFYLMWPYLASNKKKKIILRHWKYSFLKELLLFNLSKLFLINFHF